MASHTAQIVIRKKVKSWRLFAVEVVEDYQVAGTEVVTMKKLQKSWGGLPYWYRICIVSVYDGIVFISEIESFVMSTAIFPIPLSKIKMQLPMDPWKEVLNWPVPRCYQCYFKHYQRG